VSKPVEVGKLKVGQYIVLEGEPCKIMDLEKSKPGKHGSAKVRIVAIGLFTGQKRNLISPVDGRVDAPLIEKKSAQVISVGGDSVQLMDMETYQTFEAPLSADDEIRSKLASGVEVEYWSALGRNKVIRVKG